VIRFDCVTLFPEMFGAVTASGVTRRALEQEPEDHSRPTFAQQGEGLRQALIALARVLFQPPCHGASVAPLDNCRRNLQKVSSRW